MTYEERVDQIKLLIVMAKVQHPDYWRIPILEDRLKTGRAQGGVPPAHEIDNYVDEIRKEIQEKAD